MKNINPLLRIERHDGRCEVKGYIYSLIIVFGKPEDNKDWRKKAVTCSNFEVLDVHFIKGDYNALCQMRCDVERSFCALKPIFSLTFLHLRKSNCKLGLFDNTAGDQKSGLPPKEVFFIFQLDC